MRRSRPAMPTRRLREALLAIAGVSLLAIGVPSAANATTPDTWTGANASSSWNNSGNWSSGIPATGASLSFPVLSGCTGTCYTSKDDISGLSVSNIAIDSSAPYAFTAGTGISLTLTGGLTMTPPTLGMGPFHNNVSLGIPIVLSGSQAWTVDGNNNLDTLTIPSAGNISGTSTLGLTLQHLAVMELDHDMDVGSLTVSGPSGNTNFGPNAATNGRLFLAGTHLNPSGNAVALSDIDLISAGGHIGGTLSTTGDFFDIGSSTSPSTLTLDSGTTAAFDQGSTLSMYLQKPSGAMPVAGTDNSEVIANSQVSLNNVNLRLARSDFQTKCGQAVPVGTIYTLVDASAGGSLTGTFNGLPNNSTVSVGPCTNETLLRINYTSTTATATVVAAPINTTTTLSGVPSSATAGASEKYSANVATNPAGGPPPTGTVSFTDNGNSIGCDNQPLTASGSSANASCSVSSIAAGSHSIVATYKPADSSFNGSASGAQGFTATSASTSSSNSSSSSSQTSNGSNTGGGGVAVITTVTQAVIASAEDAAANTAGTQLNNSKSKSLLKMGGAPVLVTEPVAGIQSFAASVNAVDVSKQGISAKVRTIKFAAGSLTFAKAGKGTVFLRLSPKAVKILKKLKAGRHLRVKLTGKFTPAAGLGSPVSGTSRFTVLGSGKAHKRHKKH